MKFISTQLDSSDLTSLVEVNSESRRTPAFERVCAWELAFLNSGEGSLNSAGRMEKQ